jgi:hypothetical protein
MGQAFSGQIDGDAVPIGGLGEQGATAGRPYPFLRERIGRVIRRFDVECRAAAKLACVRREPIRAIRVILRIRDSDSARVYSRGMGCLLVSASRISIVGLNGRIPVIRPCSLASGLPMPARVT